MPWVEKWPVWERWSVDQSSLIFSTLHTAEVGASEEEWNMLQEWRESSWQISALLLSWEPKLVTLMGHVWPYKIQDLYPITATERREQDPRQSHARRARPWRWPQDISCLVQAKRGGGLGGVGGGGKPRLATYKMVISKWYQKSIKTFQKTLKTARVGRCIGQDLQVPMELPPMLQRFVLEARTLPPPLWRHSQSTETARVSDHGWNCPSRFGTSGLRF